jgi:hypothetical protein
LKLPRAKTPDRQLRLFDADKLLTSLGQTRYATGEFFETLTAEISGAVRLRTDSRCDICPDLRFPGESFIECKAVGKTGKIILYSERMEKYKRFLEDGTRSLYHWIWIHSYRPSRAESFNELNYHLGMHTKKLIVADFDAIQELVAGRPETCVNSGMKKPGETLASSHERQKQRGYFYGWTVPVPQLSKKCVVVGELQSRVYKQFDSNVQVLSTIPGCCFEWIRT